MVSFPQVIYVALTYIIVIFFIFCAFYVNVVGTQLINQTVEAGHFKR